jgi:hypothetical protein
VKGVGVPLPPHQPPVLPQVPDGLGGLALLLVDAGQVEVGVGVAGIEVESATVGAGGSHEGIEGAGRDLRKPGPCNPDQSSSVGP